MNNLIKSSVVTSMLLLSGSAIASQVNVQWSNPDGYTDIQTSKESKRHFKKRLFNSFEKHFASLGERLPQGYSWKITVTDLDLAGTVTNKYAPRQHDMRVIDQWFKPQITFSYQVLNEKGEVVAANEKQIIQENLIERFPASVFMQREFAYEKHMIKRWFKKSLLPQITVG